MHLPGGHGTRATSRARPRRGITLLELLLLMAVYALLLAIIVPVVGAIHNDSEVARCLANLHNISTATNRYMQAHEDRKIIPWYQYPAHDGYNITLYTPWVFGGFKAPLPAEEWSGYSVDAEQYPAEIRPLNKYVDRTARDDGPIDSFICPSDRTHSTAIIGEGWEGDLEAVPSSWEALGSSYTLNTRWAQGYSLPSGAFGLGDFHAEAGTFPGRIGKHMTGGDASAFIIWVEQTFYSATYRAGPTISGLGDGPMPMRYGWHGEFSSYSVGFADGHAAYGFFDTRQIYGLGGTIWQANYDHGL